MTELRFRADLYSGFAVDAAVKVYADYAKFELEQKDGVYFVKLTSTGDADEAMIAEEFSNYALGTTIEQHRTGMG
ncbi:MAG: HxsD-like protein [Sorangiineae bacterium]|nr:HxsD-like protein [Polyangiaceae bacterium]MEB2322174.1 HxsD-like protein [Sorangiineae bacterium]